MNLIYISTECFPFAKASGLGDLVSLLAKEIEKEGHNVRVFIPRYGCIDPAIFHIEKLPSEFKIKLNGTPSTTMIYKGILPDSLISVFLIESQSHFSNSREIYLQNEDENTQRNNFFCMASLDFILKLKLEADIIHLFNPSTAYTTRLLKDKNTEYSKLNKTPILFTIHNLVNINDELTTFTNEAINYSDITSTVSKTYAYELLSDMQNIGIADSLTKKEDSFTGILSGIDEKIYNPETDNVIAQNYSRNYFSIGKRKCKEDLLIQSGLENNLQIPLFGIVSSLREDKGIELLINSLSQISHLDLQLLILGKGEQVLEQELIKAEKKYKNIKLHIGYDHNLSKKIYAGCDFIICPSKYEPSGTSVMNAMRYGAVPIACSTGAIKDIVVDIEFGEEANGIIFKHYQKEDLAEAINKGLKIYKNKEKWPKLVKGAMSFDFGKLNTGKKYIKFYEMARAPK